MSSGGERRTQIRKIVVEKCSENKADAICVNKRGINNLYVIWVKMNDLQENLDLQNLSHLASKKIKRYCGTKHPTKDQGKKYERKMGQWTDDNKSVHIREDLAYNLICYNSLGVIKPDEFENLRISNNQSIRIEREIIASIMKIFATKSMVRQCKIGGLCFEVDLFFLVYKLIIEIDEDGNLYYDDEKHQIIKTLIENCGFTFIRINLDVEDFDLYVKLQEYTITLTNRL